MVAICEYRLKCGMTQAMLANMIGVTPNCIAQWESGVRKPNIIMLKKLASILKCSTDDLLKDI